MSASLLCYVGGVGGDHITDDNNGQKQQQQQQHRHRFDAAQQL